MTVSQDLDELMPAWLCPTVLQFFLPKYSAQDIILEVENSPDARVSCNVYILRQYWAGKAKTPLHYSSELGIHRPLTY